MAKIIRTSEEKVSEAFMCPHCGTKFETKAEDISVEKNSDPLSFMDNVDKKYYGYYSSGTIKCPYCTLTLSLNVWDCKTKYLKGAFKVHPKSVEFPK